MLSFWYKDQLRLVEWIRFAVLNCKRSIREVEQRVAALRHQLNAARAPGDTALTVDTSGELAATWLHLRDAAWLPENEWVEGDPKRVDPDTKTIGAIGAGYWVVTNPDPEPRTQHELELADRQRRCRRCNQRGHVHLMADTCRRLNSALTPTPAPQPMAIDEAVPVIGQSSANGRNSNRGRGSFRPRGNGRSNGGGRGNANRGGRHGNANSNSRRGGGRNNKRNRAN